MKGIPVIQGVIAEDMYWLFLFLMKKEGWKDWKHTVSDYFNSLRPECRVGLGYYCDLFRMSERNFTTKPYGHADEDAHTYYANVLYGIIKEKELLDVTD
jgi:hypothetical protein